MIDGGRNDSVILSRLPSTAQAEGTTYDNLEQTINEVTYLALAFAVNVSPCFNIALKFALAISFHTSRNICFSEYNTRYVSILI